MTIDIDAARKLADAATEGPWRSWTVDPRPRFQVGTTTPFRPVAEVYERSESGHDAEFIAAARTLVPALCDEIEQLRADVDRLRQERSAAATAYLDDVTDLKAELEKVRGQYADTRRHNDLLTAELADQQRANTTWANENAELKRQLESSRSISRSNARNFNTLAEVIERVSKFADEMETYCSPHGVATTYAKRLREVLNAPTANEAGVTR